MNEFVNGGFSKALNNYRGRVHQWALPLDEHQFWSKPFSYGNSFGHLVLHLTGNLNYYLGSQLLNTGYIRNRELDAIRVLAHQAAVEFTNTPLFRCLLEPVIFDRPTILGRLG
jgi:hypothetical protein